MNPQERLQHAIENRDLESALLAIKNGANTNGPDETGNAHRLCPLARAIALDAHEIADALLRRGAGISLLGDGPLYRAASKNDADMIDVLTRHGAWPSEPLAVSAAVDFGNLDALRALLDAGLDPHLDDHWVFVSAVQSGNRELLKLLFAFSDPNSVDAIRGAISQQPESELPDPDDALAIFNATYEQWVAEVVGGIVSELSGGKAAARANGVEIGL